MLMAALVLLDRKVPREPVGHRELMVMLVWMVAMGNLVLLVPLGLLVHRANRE